MEIESLTRTRALRVITPAALVVAARLEPPAPSVAPTPWHACFTLAWERASPGARQMAGYVEGVASEILGPEGPEGVRAGRIWTPLRDGDVEAPPDADLRGRVFAEISGDLHTILDGRRAPVRKLALDDAAVRELSGQGSVMRARVFLFAFDERIRVQLDGVVGVTRGAPGWETWTAASGALA